MYVAPNTVSGRVVNTSSVSPAMAVPPAGPAANRIRAPVERPIQLRCISFSDSGQSSRSRSSSSRSA
jgi:hypothetical protein